MRGGWGIAERMRPGAPSALGGPPSPRANQAPPVHPRDAPGAAIVAPVGACAGCAGHPGGRIGPEYIVVPAFMPRVLSPYFVMTVSFPFFTRYWILPYFRIS